MVNSKIAIGAALTGAFILGAAVVAYSNAQPAQPEEAQSRPLKEKVTTSFSKHEEEEIGELIRAYLMENPEVILEAVKEYSERQRQASDQLMREGAIKNIEALLDPKTAYVAGKNPSKAKVAVIELYDYHCTYCKSAAGLVKEITQTDEEVVFVFRELPILREESDFAAEMSLAARDQGKFLDLHFAMMGANGVLTKERIEEIARKQGLDVGKMEASIKKSGIPDAIEGNHKIAYEMGVEGTPAFIIASTNGDYVEVINGYGPEAILAKIAEAKKAAD